MTTDFTETTRTVLPQQRGNRRSQAAPAAPLAASIARPPAAQGIAARGRKRNRGDLALTVAGLGLGLSVGLGVDSVRHGLKAPGGPMLAAGTVMALAGTYLCLMMLLLISRIPWLEREVGHDRMVALHRKVAPYSLALILGHVVATTLSYGQAEQHSFLHQSWSLITQSRWMLPATAGFVLMMGLGVMSARPIRTRMSYETWWVAHLYFYVAVALSFGHQVVLGPMFVGHPASTWFWAGLYLTVAGIIVMTRVLLPISTSFKHQLRVAAVVEESDGVLSVYLSGVDLDLLKARGGQFFQWRFLTAQWWWQAHPYSLSASPNSSWLRITVKDLGDHSSLLQHLRPGTRVVAEGPYGVFTAAARHGEAVTAFAAGVGITPVRAVLEDLPPDTDVTVVYRVSEALTAPLRHELEELVSRHGWTLHLLEGTRADHPMTPTHLADLLPQLGHSDVYVCGPTSFTEAVLGAARAVGVPEHKLHHEAFSF